MSYKVFKLLMLVMLVFAPCAALADTVWDVTPGSGAGDCKFQGNNNRVCFADFDADEVSAMLNVAECENFSVYWDSLITGTSNLNTIQVRRSIASTASVNTSTIMGNITLTGDPATGLDVLAGYDGPYIYADIITHTAGTGRLAVMCFKRQW
jgi:hypothetical protein